MDELLPVPIPRVVLLKMWRILFKSHDKEARAISFAVINYMAEHYVYNQDGD